MNLTKIIDDLRKERDRIEEVILSLESLDTLDRPRRGRPPGSKTTKHGTQLVQTSRPGAKPQRLNGIHRTNVPDGAAN